MNCHNGVDWSEEQNVDRSRARSRSAETTNKTPAGSAVGGALDLMNSELKARRVNTVIPSSRATTSLERGVKKLPGNTPDPP